LYGNQNGVQHFEISTTVNSDRYGGRYATDRLSQLGGFGALDLSRLQALLVVRLPGCWISEATIRISREDRDRAPFEQRFHQTRIERDIVF